MAVTLGDEEHKVLPKCESFATNGDTQETSDVHGPSAADSGSSTPHALHEEKAVEGVAPKLCAEANDASAQSATAAVEPSCVPDDGKLVQALQQLLEKYLDVSVLLAAAQRTCDDNDSDEVSAARALLPLFDHRLSAAVTDLLNWQPVCGLLKTSPCPAAATCALATEAAAEVVLRTAVASSQKLTLLAQDENASCARVAPADFVKRAAATTLRVRVAALDTAATSPTHADIVVRLPSDVAAQLLLVRRVEPTSPSTADATAVLHLLFATPTAADAAAATTWCAPWVLPTALPRCPPVVGVDSSGDEAHGIFPPPLRPPSPLLGPCPVASGPVPPPPVDLRLGPDADLSGVRCGGGAGSRKDATRASRSGLRRPSVASPTVLKPGCNFYATPFIPSRTTYDTVRDGVGLGPRRGSNAAQGGRSRGTALRPGRSTVASRSRPCETDVWRPSGTAWWPCDVDVTAAGGRRSGYGKPYTTADYFTSMENEVVGPHSTLLLPYASDTSAMRQAYDVARYRGSELVAGWPCAEDTAVLYDEPYLWGRGNGELAEHMDAAPASWSRAAMSSNGAGPYAFRHDEGAEGMCHPSRATATTMTAVRSSPCTTTLRSAELRACEAVVTAPSPCDPAAESHSGVSGIASSPRPPTPLLMGSKTRMTSGSSLVSHVDGLGMATVTATHAVTRRRHDPYSDESPVIVWETVEEGGAMVQQRGKPTTLSPHTPPSVHGPVLHFHFIDPLQAALQRCRQQRAAATSQKGTDDADGRHSTTASSSLSGLPCTATDATSDAATGVEVRVKSYAEAIRSKAGSTTGSLPCVTVCAASTEPTAAARKGRKSRSAGTHTETSVGQSRDAVGTGSGVRAGPGTHTDARTVARRTAIRVGK